MPTERELGMLRAARAAGITSREEAANFMAQISAESRNLTALEESFLYTRGIQQIPVRWARRAGDAVLEDARLEAVRGQPEALADLMYGGRMGNDRPGDGYLYRGRGYIQLTGRDNYRAAGEALALDLEGNPALAAKPDNAARIAVWFWQQNVPQTEREDVLAATRRINGGTNGLDHRQAQYDRWHAILTPEFLAELDAGHLDPRSQTNVTVAPADPVQDIRQSLEGILAGTATFGPPMTDGMPDYLRVRRPPAQSEPGDRELRQGTRGSAVRELQQQLDGLGIRDGRGRTLATDGVFGPSTREAVENFQLWHGLPTSGVADRGTLAALRDPQPGLAAARPGDAADPAAGRASAAGPGDPAHPDHAMYQRIRAGVRAIDDGGGKTYDEASERVCRALLAQCKDPGGSGARPVQASPAGAALRRVDHVVMGSTGNLFAVEGRLDDPAHKRVCVAVAQVAHVDVEASDRRLSEANARIAQELDAARQHAHARHPTGPDPGAPVGMG